MTGAVWDAGLGAGEVTGPLTSSAGRTDCIAVHVPMLILMLWPYAGCWTVNHVICYRQQTSTANNVKETNYTNNNNNNNNSKHPDGSTLIPWHAGKAMAWDVTLVNTLAESYSTVTASPGRAAEHAAARKTSRYSSLPASHCFN